MREKLTQGDVEKIRQEINHRILEVRPEALDALKEARAQGDLSENFEYYAAKRFKNQNESRIRYLENMLKNAIIVSDTSARDEVGMNDLVKVYIEEDDEEETYKIVTSIRSDTMENRISTDSPLGKALLHHKVGDRVEVKVNPDYSYFLEIRSIEKTGSEEESIRNF
ncbi:MAG: transcription elongation factor GreA [Blautia sp.]|nr:transcription elongation factor GreA [Blautia sp.]